MICQQCFVEFDGYKGQRFCSRKCSNVFRAGRNLSQEVRNKIRNSLLARDVARKKVNEYVCEKCGEKFIRVTKVRSGRKAHCSACLRKVAHRFPIESVDTILKFSRRTMVKVMKRLNAGCSVCGWSDCACDIHHVLSRKKGGSDSHDNLTYLCPNHHRKAHGGQIKDFVTLTEQIGNKWKDVYGLR